MSAIFNNATQIIAAARKSSWNLYKKNAAGANGGLVFLVPTIAAASVLSAYVAVPVTIGGALFGCVAALATAASCESDRKIVDSTSVLAGVVTLAASVVSLAIYGHPTEIPDELKTNLNILCWAPNDQGAIKIGNKVYKTTIEKIVNTETVVKEIGVDAAKDSVDQSHFAKAKIDFTYSDFWFGRLVPAVQEIDLSKRPGLWNSKTDKITVGGKLLALMCGS